MEVIINEATYSKNKDNLLSSYENKAKSFQNPSACETGLSKFKKQSKLFKNLLSGGVEDKLRDFVFIFSLFFMTTIEHILEIYLRGYIKSISSTFSKW